MPFSASLGDNGGPSVASRTYPSSGGRSLTGWIRNTTSARPRSGNTEHLRGFSCGWRTMMVGGYRGSQARSPERAGSYLLDKLGGPT